jgi:flagellar M-ring protein FliF
LSAAVIVNNLTVTDKNGKTSSKSLTDAEKARIEVLVKEAIGYNETRGDTLKVENVAFTVEKEPPPEIPLWKQPETIELAKDVLRYLIIAGIGLYLLFGVIRPAFMNIENARKQVEEEKVRLAEEAKAALGITDEVSVYDDNLKSVKHMARTDPKVVAAVIMDWIRKDE